MLVKLKGWAEKIKRGIAGATAVSGQSKSAREIFADIYRSNYWGNSDSRSGAGSDLVQTEVVRRELPVLISEFEVNSMLDIPCGDWHWMKETNLDVDYIGADIVPEIVQHNNELYGKDRRGFRALDMIKDDLPKVDLVFSRDVLVHLSFEDIFSALRNIERSGSRYLLTTTFTRRDSNFDITTGQWRPVNLQKAPFNFPAPLRLINENCTEGDGSWGDKSLGLWEISGLKIEQ
ncbi:MAG: class I SAM-dependent methyltransferase [Nitrosomonadales bacterium]|nr:class I SAM-dependent methyltransferase [Nitrosomonadales bacterium]